MKNDTVDQLTILRYITGECTPEERREVYDWSRTSADHAKSIRQLKDIWDAGSVSTDEMQFQVDEDWRRLENRIDTSGRPGREEYVDSQRFHMHAYKPGGTGRSISMWMKVAAAFLVVSMSALFFWQLSHQAQQEEEMVSMREIIMERGQQSNMLLSDGSHITINADSHIRLPDRFESDRRDLYLESGEIFVDIESDPDRPFFIHTKESVIRVLGTAFSVRSYPEEREVRVVVREGIVSLASSQNSSRHISLIENQMGRYYIDNNQLSSEFVQDTELFFGWMDGYLKFDEAPLERVIRDLERRYNVRIVLEDPSLGSKRLTAELKGRSIQNVLNVLSSALDLDIEQLEENRIMFRNSRNTQVSEHLTTALPDRG
ncbi:MAG: FecR domain-containing protein [Balneolaceae bacterium]